MIVKCPGCKSNLNLGTEMFTEKVVIRCPECLQIFIARADDAESGAEAAGEATLLVSDRAGVKKEINLWQNANPSLTVIRGPEQGIHLSIKKDEMVIGREDADLVVSDPAVSRWHCRIFKDKNKYYLEDLGSTNSTFVNKRKVQRAELAHLDEIELGQTLIVFSELGQAEEIKSPDLSQELDQLRDETKVSASAPGAKLPKGRDFYLEVMSKTNRAWSHKITKSPLIIGRGEEADLKLDDTEVSRKHAMIEIFSKENVYLTDLASANGTFLNGTRIRSMLLRHGDKIRTGDTLFKFIVKDLIDAK